jgi:hypothetical protein
MDIAPHQVLLERCAMYRQLWAQQHRHMDGRGSRGAIIPRLVPWRLEDAPRRHGGHGVRISDPTVIPAKACERIIHRYFFTLPRRKPGPIAPRHGPIRAGTVVRSFRNSEWRRNGSRLSPGKRPEKYLRVSVVRLLS